jgi:Tfp pilus assembly protein PilN
MRTILKQNSSSASFLPADYLDRKRERRANLFCLSLFLIVIFGVVAAFFVTNRRWEEVREHQQTINVRYAQAAKDIEQLKQLEAQKSEMLGKAELTAALIEKAPRSVVIAEIINRLPDKAALLQLELKSDRPRTRAAPAPTPQAGGQSLTNRAGQQQQPAAPRFEVPRVITGLSIVGVANTHNDVASFVNALQNCGLLERVDLRYSELTTIDKQELNRFLIQTRLRPDADARSLDINDGVRAGAFLGGGGGTPSTADATDDKEN